MIGIVQSVSQSVKTGLDGLLGKVFANGPVAGCGAISPFHGWGLWGGFHPDIFTYKIDGGHKIHSILNS